MRLRAWFHAVWAGHQGRASQRLARAGPRDELACLLLVRFGLSDVEGDPHLAGALGCTGRLPGSALSVPTPGGDTISQCTTPQTRGFPAEAWGPVVCLAGRLPRGDLQRPGYWVHCFVTGHCSAGVQFC